ncbi:MAG: hypothetical protein C0P77_010755 [Thermoanaerobacterales bacterium]|jgi:hypothetical protein|nr:hypothetical protein [Thermoanaerobacterales bacterium]
MTPTSPYSTRFKIVASAVVAVAVALLVVAVRSFDDGNDDPVLRSGDQDVVEALIPRRDAQVPRQSRVGIDLAIGWEGTLVIDGVEIPADQLDVTPELGLIEYTPGDGKAVEELQPGQNCVSAVIWRSQDGRGVADRTVPWCFEVV